MASKKKTTPPPAPAPTAGPCRGACGQMVPVLAGICPVCRELLPAELRVRVEETHSRGDIVARITAQDAARAWLLARRNPLAAEPLVDVTG